MTDPFDSRKIRAAAWFHTLRDRIVAAFEALEDSVAGPEAPGRFEVTPTTRADGGGGIMSVMRSGRAFEKVGVNRSEVYGTLGERAQKAMAARGVPGTGAVLLPFGGVLRGQMTISLSDRRF